MIKEPLLLRHILSPQEILGLKSVINLIKQAGDAEEDNDYFFRKYVHNPASLLKLHAFLAVLFSKIIKIDLIPSYSFISMYTEGKGICPLHIDREQCHLTVDICIDHLEPWPIYINHAMSALTEADLFEKNEEIKKGSLEYILMPGDAVIYSGTNHPHWRNQIKVNNFCDLVFFHFVAKD